jgi:hypothetical protein
MKTTLNKIKEYGLHEYALNRLLEKLGKKECDDAPLSLSTVLALGGLLDAIWCFRTIDKIFKREKILFGVWCAKKSMHLVSDYKLIDHLEIAERFANELATKEELMESGGNAYIIASKSNNHADLSVSYSHWYLKAAYENCFFAISERTPVMDISKIDALRFHIEKEFRHMVYCIENNQRYAIS